MNYKGFKKVHDDDDKAILQNPKGHSITISKKALSPKYLEGLKSLPLHAAQGMPSPDPEPAPAPDDSASETPQQPAPGVNIYVGGAQPQANPQAASTPVPTPVPDQPAPAPAPPQAQAPAQQSAPAQESQAAEPEERAPAQDEIKPFVVPKAPSQELPAPAQPQVTPGQQFVTEMQNWSKDLQIHPKTYSDVLWKNEDGSEKGFFGKVGTIFGLLLSGAGSGLSHQPSVFLKMMDDEINRDIEAQKTSKTNQMDLGKLLQSHLLNQATISKNTADVNHLALQDNVTRNLFHQSLERRKYMDRLYNDIVSKYPPGSPQRQQAESAFGALSQTINAEDQNAAAMINSRMALFQNAAPGGDSGAGGPVDYGKFNQLERNSQMKVPGAPSSEDIQKMTHEAGQLGDVDLLKNGFLGAYDKVNNMVAAGNFSPHLRDALTKPLIAKATKLGEGRYTEAANEAYSSMLPQVGDSPNTRKEKRAQAVKFFGDLGGSAPTLSRFGARNKSAASTASKLPPEGTTGTMADGTRAVVKGGKLVPLK